MRSVRLWPQRRRRPLSASAGQGSAALSARRPACRYRSPAERPAQAAVLVVHPKEELPLLFIADANAVLRLRSWRRRDCGPAAHRSLAFISPRRAFISPCSADSASRICSRLSPCFSSTEPRRRTPRPAARSPPARPGRVDPPGVQEALKEGGVRLDFTPEEESDGEGQQGRVVPRRLQLQQVGQVVVPAPRTRPDIFRTTPHSPSRALVGSPKRRRRPSARRRPSGPAAGNQARFPRRPQLVEACRRNAAPARGSRGAGRRGSAGPRWRNALSSPRCGPRSTMIRRPTPLPGCQA